MYNDEGCKSINKPAEKMPETSDKLLSALSLILLQGEGKTFAEWIFADGPEESDVLSALMEIVGPNPELLASASERAPRYTLDLTWLKMAFRADYSACWNSCVDLEPCSECGGILGPVWDPKEATFKPGCSFCIPDNGDH